MSASNPIVSVHLTHVWKSLAEVTSATTTDSSSADGLGFTEALCIMQFGTTTGTSGTGTVSVIASDATGGTYAAITGATTSALTLDTGGQTNKFVAIPVTLTGKNRWLKIRLVTAGTVATGILQGYIIFGGSINKGLPSGSTLHPEGGVKGKTAYDTVVSHVT